MSSYNFYLYSDLIGIDRDTIKIYYDFEESGDPVVYNVASGNHGANAPIINQNVFFWNNPDSGFFSCDTFLQPDLSGYNGLDAGDWTIMVLYNKVFRDSYDDDSLTNEILFSNLSSGNGVASGIAIGTNGFGNFFFEAAISSGMSQFYCGNTAYSPKQAAYFVKNGQFLFFGGYDSGTNVLGAESFYLISGLNPSDLWQIAKGNEGGYGQFEGYIDEFVFISGALDYPTLSLLISGMIADRTTGAYVRSTGYYSGVTGYQNQITLRSGITGYDISITGAAVDNCGNVVPLYELLPITGFIPFTGTIAVSGNIFYSTKVFSGAENILDSNLIDGMYFDDFGSPSGFDGNLFESGMNNIYNNVTTFFNII